MPWKLGRSLVWDATCVDTLAPSHLPITAGCAGSAAASAESLKRRKYYNLASSYIYEPFGVETLGPWGPSALKLFKNILKRLVDTSRDQRAGLFLGQRLSIAMPYNVAMLPAFLVLSPLTSMRTNFSTLYVNSCFYFFLIMNFNL
ncbi:unnamed protein product [Spodoptera littoralis]|uniref:Uncharacterized protein n=1 Tax=Spodoptera littoralis TaxID=7109 RepID=A0A9P0I4Q1_SPOLI|nr:unnamed protein product [Spodoptera littoralis]